MKKYSTVFILVQTVTVFLISWLIAMGFAFLAFSENIPLAGLTNWLPITLPIVAVFYVFLLSNRIGGFIAKKTMEKNSKAQNFGKAITYTNKQAGTVGSILRIDEETGRIAYVSCQNPFKFQTAEAFELTDVISAYKKGPLDTTNYVYFQFCCKNMRTRIPTYAQGHYSSITFPDIKESIKRADRFRNIVSGFQKRG